MTKEEVTIARKVCALAKWHGNRGRFRVNEMTDTLERAGLCRTLVKATIIGMITECQGAVKPEYTSDRILATHHSRVEMDRFYLKHKGWVTAVKLEAGITRLLDASEQGYRGTTDRAAEPH